MPTRQLRERVLTHLIHAQVDTFTNYAQGFIDYLKTVEGGLGEFPVEEMSTRTYINRFGCKHLEDGACGVSTNDAGTFVKSTLAKKCQTPCGGGRYAKYTMHTQKADDTGCNDCFEGRFNADTTHYVGTCSRCASGTYSSLKAATSCQDCPDDFNSPAGSTAKSDCTKSSSDVKADDDSPARRNIPALEWSLLAAIAAALFF